MQYVDVQKIAKDTMEYVKEKIHSGMTLPERTM